MELEAVVVQRLPDPVRPGDPLAAGAPAGPIDPVHRDPVAALVLGLVHREVRRDQEVVLGARVRVEEGHPDAGRDPDRAVPDRKLGVADRLRELRGDHLRSLQIGLGQQHAELVAADPGERVAAADASGERRAHGADQVVADLVTQRVVDPLEVVQVDEEQRRRAVVAAGALELASQLAREAPAVHQAGQAVVVRQVREVALEALALGDVLDLADEVERLAVLVAKERDRQQDPDRPPVGAEVALLHLVAGDLAGEHLPDLLEVGLEVVGMGDVLERLGEELALGVSGQVAERTVDAHPAALGGDEGDPDRRVVERLREPLLLDGPLGLELPVCGDVDDAPEVAGDRPGGVEDRGGAPEHPDLGGVGPHEAVLAVELAGRAIGAGRLDPLGEDPRTIVAVERLGPAATERLARAQARELAPAVVDERAQPVRIRLEDAHGNSARYTVTSR